MKIILSCLLILNVLVASTQNVAVNNDGTSPDPKAILDIKSTTKGILIPRMTQAQRVAISSPPQGLIVYQTDGEPGLYYNQSSVPSIPFWNQATPIDRQHWDKSLSGNHIYFNTGAGSENVGIGTTFPLEAGLVVNKKVGAVNAMFGANTTGIAIESNFPGIGFNSYYNAGRKTIADGYTGLISFNPVAGDLRLSTSTSSTVADAASTIQTRLMITTDGNIGIQGNTAPHAPLSFANFVGNKLSLWGTDPATHYGMGIQASLMQFYTNGSNADMAFGYGSSTSFTENIRFKGNGNIGIGNINPTAKLAINQNSNAVGLEVSQSGTGLGSYFYSEGNNAVYGLTSSATSAAGYFVGTNALVAMGRVGVGTSTPETRLTIEGGGLGFMQTDGTTKIATEILGGEGAMGTQTNHGLRLRTNGTTKMYISPAGNIGIGTFSPLEKLDIAGKVRIADGSQAANRVLTSNATGVATWEDIAYGTNDRFLANTNSLDASQYVLFTTAYNNGSAFTISGNTVTINKTGLYHFEAAVSISLTVGATTNYILRLDMNGHGMDDRFIQAVGAGAAPGAILKFSHDRYMVAGSTIQLRALYIISNNISSFSSGFFSGYLIAD